MPENATPTVHVVGGGMTGLTAALRLSRVGWRVIVHEREPYLGGLARESEIAGVPAEAFYHCVLPTDVRLLALFDEIGLADAVGWNRTRTGFYDGKRLHELTTTLDFLRFGAIGPVDRARLAWTILYCGAFRDGQRFGREPVGKFLRRHGGDRLFERIWEPLLVSKLGPDYDRFAASFIWATVQRMLSARKARGRSEKLGFVKSRYGRVFAALRESIEERGGAVRAGRTVDGLEPDPSGGWTLTIGDESVSAPAVLLCTPAPVTARLLETAGLHGPAGAFGTIDHLGVLCESLLLRRSVTPYYVLNLIAHDLPFTGVIETSNLTGTQEFGGKSLVYLPRYRSQDHPDWDRDDEDLHRENLAGLRRIAPSLGDDEILGWRMHRARSVQPVHAPGHGDRLPPIALGPRLAAVSSAHLYPWPAFNDESVGNVDRALPRLLQVLAAQSAE